MGEQFSCPTVYTHSEFMIFKVNKSGKKQNLPKFNWKMLTSNMWLRQFELFQIDYNFTKIKIFVVGGFSSVVTLVLSEIYYGDQGPDVMRCMYFKFRERKRTFQNLTGK
jgi:hypothetical protein